MDEEYQIWNDEIMEYDNWLAESENE